MFSTKLSQIIGEKRCYQGCDERHNGTGRKETRVRASSGCEGPGSGGQETGSIEETASTRRRVGRGEKGEADCDCGQEEDGE